MSTPKTPASVGSLAAVADRFSLVPNPATATTTLHLPAGSAATEARLLDVQGRVCATQKGVAGTTTLSFATDALPAGLYFVKVTETGQPPVVLKLVKQEDIRKARCSPAGFFVVCRQTRLQSEKRKAF